MSLSPVTRSGFPAPLNAPESSPVLHGLEPTALPETKPVLFVSTFRAKPEWKPMMRYELGRLARATRRQRECLSCDLFRSPSDFSVFLIHSLWTTRDTWLAYRGWEGNPFGMGLLDQCLLQPIETTEIDAGTRDIQDNLMPLR